LQLQFEALYNVVPTHTHKNTPRATVRGYAWGHSYK